MAGRKLSAVNVAGESAKPFWCPPIDLQPYKPRARSMDGLFKGFMTETGHHANVIYEGKTQVDNGPLLFTDYYQLIHGKIARNHGIYTRKKHAFKKYKSLRHRRFFSIDLYEAEGAVKSGTTTTTCASIPSTSATTRCSPRFWMQ